MIPPGDGLGFRVTVIGESLGLKLLNGLEGVRSVRIGSVDASLELLGVEVVRVDELWRVGGGGRFRVDFLSPVRFAKRSTMGRRRRVRFDFCPSIVNILFTTINHYSGVVGLGNEFRSWPYLLRWAYNYVYMRDLRGGRVVATRHAGRPELGFIGSVEFEIVSRRQSRIQQLWHLLNYAELVNVGTGRSMGFGVIRITAMNQNQPKQGQ
ncbi:CRISPR system precrRNA processing endoribonuclease RAMP protein Cas6 [Vulcanisaeta distributa]|uniref:CRISPR system precrRNA processing endoribonuclease RAMP protein Cas6 n=1 Tax=Vulcanisaeta distributa TaxID=164451 RepID=UPI001FB3FC7C|nr:CRISPR system precrRNA processing endoribonuclease RAMP protein Cas6 [Vulcanisaeta distributa]